MQDYAAQMHALFQGAENDYGYIRGKIKEAEETGKRRGEHFIRHGPATDELWLKHLRGEQSLGIIPINDQNQCRWSCIDVDEYPAPTERIWKSIDEYSLPLYTFYSKSGGLHVILFLTKPFPAKAVRACMRDIASVLALGGKEIFPKQDTKDTGNFLNMPYFGKNTRQCVTRNGQLSLEAFLDFVKPVDKLPKIKPTEIDLFPDGPPCLQLIAKYGPVAANEKHETMRAVGTYFKLADKEHWIERTRELNFDTRILPAGHTGIEPLIIDLGKNDWPYACNLQPLEKHCRREICLTRLYGVGKGKCALVNIHNHGDHETTVITATVFSNGKEHKIRLTPDQLLDPKKFRVAAYTQIHDYPPIISQTKWLEFLETVPKTSEFTTHSQDELKFDDLIRWLQRNKTFEKMQLLSNDKKAFFDRRRKRVCFKAASAAKALGISLPLIEQLVLNNGGGNKENINFTGNITRRFSWLPEEAALENLPVAEIPEIEEEPC